MSDDLGSITNRIDRIENKLDKLVNAITELVRVQVKIQSATERLDAHSITIKELDARLDVIEQRMPIINLVINAGSKISIAVLTMIVLGIVGSFFVF